MPKTRDEKFKESMNEFLENNVYINDDYYRFHYGLRNTTDNKTRHVHKYRLEIYGLKESDFNTGENTLDILPTTQQFIECMRDYFDPYKLTRNNLTLSQLKITIAGDVDPVSVITFKVVYYKQHLPFPVKLTVMERLENYENEIQFLNERIEYEQQNSRRVNKLLRQERRRLSYSQVKIEKLFKDNFVLKNEICNCPICWEEVSSENMHVPICLHPVCKQCLPRITKCPLCREKLVNHDHIV